jgi:DNA-binding transcriptional LysR family regulator
MELRHLRYFVAVAEELHFGRAADRVHIAQPPLSRQIALLEEEIGVRLFERTKRRVQLTHAGKVFLEEARRILALSDEAAQAARRAERGEIGRLVVAFVVSAAYMFVPLVLRAFRKRFPDVELILRELTTEQQLDALHDSSIHVGFLRQPTRTEALSFETVLREPFMLAVPSDHPLASEEGVELENLAEEPFVMFSRQQGATFHDLILSACANAGFSPKVAQEGTQIPTVLGLVSVGIGVALAPASVLNLRIPRVTYKPLIGLTQTTELAMVWRRDDASPVSTAFLQVAREMAFEL